MFHRKSILYKEPLKYFKDNWIHDLFIEFQNLEDVLEDRTNICEDFNSVLNKHIGVLQPSLAVLVSKFKELELYYRMKIIRSINQTTA